MRNRKTRLTKLRDLAKDLLEEQQPVRNHAGGNQRCPVCSQEVLGSHEERVMVAHVDACILETANAAEQSRLWTESRSAAMNDRDAGLREYEIDGERRIRVTDLAGFRGRLFRFSLLHSRHIIG
jgi:DNA repair exonuclease SbcCD ATPase subunit